ncbi:SGNH/GDSL hydrolase family protein [Spirilliplanes yamanashiensis]|uniref:SGNH/GDSL hydrolase family protein n=1 Tax=Spirilliplanes yamanashiensis TaxID=42233 RepID=UPI001951B5FD|nr:SGNH/GDSL hydrolase family protein [Spirilliplanes yamanashiensis]MDP9818935.1 lysophospholipase L1-like esterase [Spirilliplanes yamanashiensis]
MRTVAHLRALALLGVLALAACGTTPPPRAPAAPAAPSPGPAAAPATGPAAGPAAAPATAPAGAALPAAGAATAAPPVAGVAPPPAGTGAAPGAPAAAAALAGIEPAAARAPRGSALRPLRIMPLGDSITLGRGDRLRDGYRRELGALLTAAGVHHDFVGSQRDGTGPDIDHEGHSGWTITEARGRVGGWLAAARPDVVLLDLGTNDMIQGIDPGYAPVRLADLVDTILAWSPDVRVVVATLIVTPTQGQFAARPGRARAAPLMLAYNSQVRLLAAARGPRVRLAEMAVVRWADTRDGLHPTPRGYRLMAYRWYQQLAHLMPGGAAWPAPPAVTKAAARQGRRVG